MDMRFNVLLVTEEPKDEPELHAKGLELRSGSCRTSDSEKPKSSGKPTFSAYRE